MSASQIIKCKHCSKTYEPFLTAHGKVSVLCPKCRENQIASDAKRKNRVRNYQAEGKRNLDANWKLFLSKTLEKRMKEVSITKEEYLELIQRPCTYCNYYNEEEINGIDRLDNTKGYILDNCTSCCKHCNRLKHILHPVFFIKKAELIKNYQTNTLDEVTRNEFYRKWSIYIHKSPTPYIYVKRMSEEKRGLEFTLTKEHYETLIYKPCYLCGFKNIVGNGLDRQETSKGYTYENVLPCCSTCNMMKAFYNKDDFIKQVTKIAHFKQSYPSEWDSIACIGFQMGAAKSEVVKEEKVKQWRSVSIYKAIKSDCLEDFKKRALEDTNWSKEIYEEKTKILFQKVKESPYENVENDLKKLVETIRYMRRG
jgi:hypothetical protein